MNDKLREQIKILIREELQKLIPDFFGRTMVQLKEFFNRNIN